MPSSFDVHSTLRPSCGCRSRSRHTNDVRGSCSCRKRKHRIHCWRTVSRGKNSRCTVTEPLNSAIGTSSWSGSFRTVWNCRSKPRGVLISFVVPNGIAISRLITPNALCEIERPSTISVASSPSAARSARASSNIRWKSCGLEFSSAEFKSSRWNNFANASHRTKSSKFRNRSNGLPDFFSSVLMKSRHALCPMNLKESFFVATADAFFGRAMPPRSITTY